MNFLNIGPWELSVILIIAILMIGPKRMVEVTRAIGRITTHMRKLSGEFMSTIQTELRTVEQEARQAAGVVGEERQSSSIADISTDLKALGRETRQALSGIVVDVESAVEEKPGAAEGEQNG